MEMEYLGSANSKLRNQLVSHRENKIGADGPNSLEDILRKGFSTGVSYMYSSLFEVSQCNCLTPSTSWEKEEDDFTISCFGEISRLTRNGRNILYLISKSVHRNPGWVINARVARIEVKVRFGTHIGILFFDRRRKSSLSYFSLTYLRRVRRDLHVLAGLHIFLNVRTSIQCLPFDLLPGRLNTSNLST
ncbi:ATP synthase subunit 8 [Datura stramonium]|uniref:ATP synthase subunit 8 n=1 Tax=Datura stramonium TaxID=4076 RepID=A0ABS8W315_DATST|nr:ATP synthase subunit 8 [Datura stramonium]